MKKIICSVIAIASMAALLGCASSAKRESSETTRGSQISATTIQVPFKQADKYFVRNDVESIPQTPITTKEDFDNLFGSAPVMGKGGMPTSIDFSKEYVLAVSLPKTNRSVHLSPISLEQDSTNRQILFSYKIETLDDTPRSYSIVPCLILVVSNKYKGSVVYEEVR